MGSKQHVGPFNLEFKYFDQYNSSVKVPINVRKTKNFDFFEALSSKYDVLDKILEYLDCRDLKNVAELSDSLANSVEVILRKRISPVLFSLTPHCYVMPSPVDINPSLCLLFKSLMNDNDSGIKLNTFICLHAKKNTRKPVIEFLENDLLPSKCPIAALSCRHVSSTFTDNLYFNGIIFPIIPNVKISVFRITELNKKIMSKVLEENIGNNNNLVCILTYALMMRKKNIKSMVRTICDRQPGVNFALGGGFVSGMQSFNQTFQKTLVCKKTDLMCVAFSVPKNNEVEFNAYSIVIKEDATGTEEIKEYLEKLKVNYIRRKYGIAFRITCVSRQEEVNKEMELLRKLFPGIEVLGFSGDGEIGWDCYPNHEMENTDAKEPKKHKLDPNIKILHELTTIIVLVTWGKRKLY